MATILDSLITEYIGVDKNSASAEKIANANDRLGKEVLKVVKAIEAEEKAQQALDKISESYSNDLFKLVGIVKKASQSLNDMDAAARGAAGGGLARFAERLKSSVPIHQFLFGINQGIQLLERLEDVLSKPFKTAVRFDGLMRGLTAVAGSTEEAQNQFLRLKEVAKLPGLGMEEAIQGSIRLQAAGFQAGLAERALKAFGNAVATVGGGKSELQGVALALGQIASKGKIYAEEINQINERVPQIRRAMIAAFGTADTMQLQSRNIGAVEFVTKVTEELEKLPKVTGGIGNALENMSDKIQLAMLPLGKSMIPLVESFGPPIERMLDRVIPMFERLDDVMQKVAKGGNLRSFAEAVVGDFERVKNIIALTAGAFAAFGSFAIISGFVRLVSEVIKLAKAFNAAAIAAAVLDALSGNIPGLIAGVVALGVGVGVYLKVSDALDNLDNGSALVSQRPRPAASAGAGEGLAGNVIDSVTAGATTETVKGKGGGLGSLLELMQRAVKVGTAVNKQRSEAMEKAQGIIGKNEDRQIEYMKSIAKASETTAQNTKPDVREMLFGGGDRGRSGVSLLDISPRTGPGAAGPYNDRGPRKIDIRTGESATALERGIVEVLRQNLPTVLRSLGIEARF